MEPPTTGWQVFGTGAHSKDRRSKTIGLKDPPGPGCLGPRAGALHVLFFLSCFLFLSLLTSSVLHKGGLWIILACWISCPLSFCLLLPIATHPSIKLFFALHVTFPDLLGLYFFSLHPCLSLPSVCRAYWMPNLQLSICTHWPLCGRAWAFGHQVLKAKNKGRGWSCVCARMCVHQWQ